MLNGAQSRFDHGGPISISLSDSLQDELNCPLRMKKRILSSLPISEDDDEGDDINVKASPLLSRMNLTMGNEDKKTSTKCGTTQASITDEVISEIAKIMTNLIKEHSVAHPQV